MIKINVINSGVPLETSKTIKARLHEGVRRCRISMEGVGFWEAHLRTVQAENWPEIAISLTPSSDAVPRKSHILQVFVFSSTSSTSEYSQATRPYVASYSERSMFSIRE